jgi:hypothetical protein
MELDEFLEMIDKECIVFSKENESLPYLSAEMTQGESPSSLVRTWYLPQLLVVISSKLSSDIVDDDLIKKFNDNVKKMSSLMTDNMDDPIKTWGLNKVYFYWKNLLKKMPPLIDDLIKNLLEIQTLLIAKLKTTDVNKELLMGILGDIERSTKLAVFLCGQAKDYLGGKSVIIQINVVVLCQHNDKAKAAVLAQWHNKTPAYGGSKEEKTDSSLFAQAKQRKDIEWDVERISWIRLAEMDAEKPVGKFFGS